MVIDHDRSPITAYHLPPSSRRTWLLATQALLQAGIEEHKEERQESHHISGREKGSSNKKQI
jgi:hypothetical protein